jgi:uncharacterized protein YraI
MKTFARPLERRSSISVLLLIASFLLTASISCHSGEYRLAGLETDDVLNLRSGPGQNKAVVAKLAPTTRGIETISDTVWNGDDDWVKIRVNGLEGWVRPKYLQTLDDAVIASPVRTRDQSSGRPAAPRTMNVIFPQWWLNEMQRDRRKPRPGPTVVIPGFLAGWTRHVYLLGGKATTGAGNYGYFGGYKNPEGYFALTLLLTEEPHPEQVTNSWTRVPPGKRAVVFEGLFNDRGQLLTTSPVQINYWFMGTNMYYVGFVNDNGYHGRGYIQNHDEKSMTHAIFEDGQVVRSGTFEELAESGSLAASARADRDMKVFLPALAIAAVIVGKGLGMAATGTSEILKSGGGDTGGRSAVITCPHCREGKVSYQRKNLLDHWVWDSKPCTYCHGTGKVLATKP